MKKDSSRNVKWYRHIPAAMNILAHWHSYDAGEKPHLTETAVKPMCQGLCHSAAFIKCHILCSSVEKMREFQKSEVLCLVLCKVDI